MKKNSFMQGTIIAASSIIFVKILGALYVIPFYKIIGKEGGALYTYAYTIYNLFLNISTAGIPIALSMIVSEFCAKKMYDAKERSYKIAKKLVSILSIVSFLIIFIFADKIAYFLTSGNVGFNTLSDIALSIRAISVCLLLTPLLGVLRGYLQGHKYISPSSFSQVLEQVVRIIVLLLGSFLIIKVFNLKVSYGVSIALIAAFIGAIFAYIYLRFKINKNSDVFNKSEVKDDIKDKQILKKIITYCIPIILISIISNLYDAIDLKLIIKGLNMINYDPKSVEEIASIINTWTPKICVIIASISMGLITSLIPHIIRSYVNNDMKDVNNKFNLALSTMFLITLPMTLCLIFLSNEIYYLFYGYSNYGPLLLKYVAVVNLFFSLVTIINTVLQGIKKFKLIYITTLIGLFINTILDIPLILLFNELNIYPYIGTVVSSIIGYSISFILVIIILKKKLNFNYNEVFKNIKKMILPLLSMILILIIFNLISFKLTYINSIIKFVISGFISTLVYVFICYKNGLIYDIFNISLKDKIKQILKKTSKNS